ncbi:MAG TPA: heavy metal translocating P-type ATPase [Candidatus Dormibacteraeota bacterium]|nr:heavy metal translocating P-type ATPase [Candidatus Dormibacteraeota bacterium]
MSSPATTEREATPAGVADSGASEERRVHLDVVGMSCASCVHHVEQALAAVPGVSSVSVNLATERAVVSAAGGVEAQALVGAVRGAGYEASVPAPRESLAAGAAARGARRRAELRRREVQLGFAAVLSAAVLGLAYGAPDAGWSRALQLVLAFPVFVWVGAMFHRSALQAARHGSTTMDTLVSLGSSIAFLYSVVVVIALPGRMPFFDVSTLVITLIAVGKYLELRARGRAGAAIEALATVQPRVAHLLRRADARADAGEPVDVGVEELRRGDLVLVRPGEAVPVDGVVVVGEGFADEALVTGESAPVSKAVGDGVIGGTVNGDAPLQVRVTRTGEDTVLASIVRLVEQAQADKAPVQRLADRVSAVFVPAILVVAALTFLGWMLTGHSAVEAMIPAVAVLVVACPCALGLATPAAVMVASGRGAELGLLVRGGEALERIHALRTVVLDKTGTLTVGRPVVVGLSPAGEVEALRLAAAVEMGSEHPLARAVVEAAVRLGVDVPAASEVRGHPGGGVSGVVGGHAVLVGSGAWLSAQGVAAGRFEGAGDAPASAVAGLAPAVSSAGVAAAGSVDASAGASRNIAGAGASPAASKADPHTEVLVAVDGHAALRLQLADALRPDARDGVARLRAEGLRVILASGDRADTVATVAAQAGIDEHHGELSPAAKAALITRLRDADAPIAMVGDGINDTPALAAADIGIALATGTGAAMAAADITLVHGDVASIASAIALSRATLRVIRQNLAWAFGYNLVLVPLAVFDIVPPVLAALAMAFSSVSVVANALRLRRFGRDTR